jgi:hypothetical protein
MFIARVNSYFSIIKCIIGHCAICFIFFPEWCLQKTLHRSVFSISSRSKLINNQIVQNFICSLNQIKTWGDIGETKMSPQFIYCICIKAMWLLPIWKREYDNITIFGCASVKFFARKKFEQTDTHKQSSKVKPAIWLYNLNKLMLKSN